MVLIPSIAREFTDGYVTSYTNTAGLTPVTYTFSDTQDHLKLYNNGSDTITFSVGTYSNVSLGRGKVWEEDVSFNSITLQANSSSQEFHILAKKFMLNDFTSTNNSISSINTQLVDIATLAKRIIGVPYPQNFPWQPLNIYKIGKRQYGTDFDIEKYRNQGVNKTYYVSMTGLSTNDGLTQSTPLGAVYQALQKSDVDRIIVAPGIYPKDNGFKQVSPNRNISIIGLGKVILSNHDPNITWVATSGQTNVWQANRSTVANVFDASQVDVNGDYSKLTAQTSIANVNANVGSYYFDSTNNIVYVKTSDSRQPDSNIRVYLTGENNIVTGNITVYMENIHFHGGQNPFKVYSSPSIKPTLIAKQCKFKYGSQAGNGCFYNAGAISYLMDCEAAKGEQDGFNYHQTGGYSPNFVEIDCIGRDNGSVDDNDNGSTCHDGGTGIRINGQYFRNKGPNVIDINDNAHCWCVGVEAYDSLASATVNKVNFSTYGDTTAKSNFYMYDCYSHGSSTYDLKMDIYGHIFIKTCDLSIGLNYMDSSNSILDTY